MKIGRIELKFEKRKTYKEKVADNFNYLDKKIDELSAFIRANNLEQLNKDVDDLSKNLAEYGHEMRQRVEKLEDGLKQATVILDNLTKR